MSRFFLYAAPGIAVLALLSGLDMAVPMLDHWRLLEGYAQIAEGGFRWWQIFEPHSEIQILALPRAVLAPLAFATDWSLKAEALLDVAIAGVTLGMALLIARRSESLLGRGQSTVAGALMAVLVFSPVLWWAWIWTVAFVHLAINVAVVTTAWALTPVGTPLTMRRLAIAFAACLLASWTRVEGLLTWWIFIPCLLDALSRSADLPRGRVLAAWVAGGLVQAALYLAALTLLAPDTRAQVATLTFEPWSNLVFTLNLLGAPLAGFLQAILPDVADSRRYAPAGAIVLLAYVVLTIRFAAARRAYLRSQTLPWITIGFFGLTFAAAIGVGRVQVLKSGLITFAYVSTYATTSTLVAISVLQLGLLALADRGAGPPTGQRPGRALWKRRIAWLSLASVSVCLVACYLAIVPTVLAERDRWRGRERCFELAGYLDATNSCFVRTLPEKVEKLAMLGFREGARSDLEFVETPPRRHGVLEHAGPSDDAGYVSVEGYLEPSDSQPFSRTILLGRIGRRSFFARGLSEPRTHRFALSVPDYVIPAGGVSVHAWVYEPESARFVRLAGEVQMGVRPTRGP